MVNKLFIERYMTARRADVEREQAQLPQHMKMLPVMAQMLHSSCMENARKVRVTESLKKLVDETITTRSHLLPDVAYAPNVPARAYWFEFARPLSLFSNSAVEGMLFCRPANYNTLIQNTIPASWRKMHAMMSDNNTEEWSLDIIENTQAAVVFSSEYWPSKKEWRLRPQHICPFGKCQYILKEKRVMPCEQCVVMRELFAILTGTLILADQGYFRETVELSEQVHCARKINKAGIGSKPNYQEVQVEHEYHILHVDATAPRMTSRKRTEARGSWLAAHEVDEILHVEQTVTRTYRHERYKNMLGKRQQVKRTAPLLRKNIEKTLVQLHASTHEHQEQLT